MNHNPNYIPATLLLSYPVQPEDELPELIVCAANQYTYNNTIHTIVGIRHGCESMWSQIDNSTIKFEDLAILKTEIQGFITNKQRFVNRKEAWDIAIQQKQIRRSLPCDHLKELFSEHLY